MSLHGALDRLPIAELVSGELRPPDGLPLGRSLEGRPIVGHRLGQGGTAISLIAGCHADEPVGPAMLDRLAAFLSGLEASDPLLARLTWRLVPHVNPDGEARNAAWSHETLDLGGGRRGFDLGAYLRGAVRELPGDDVEFGFPRDADDRGARPENLAVADFLRAGGPVVLHASFHGMGFGAGPWFLLERSWAERTRPLQRRLRQEVSRLGYRLHDVDRRGEKGFHRLAEGFTSRPDSRAMAAHFRAGGDESTAALFRPSSMELARSFGGDPLTLVSEMPLFLTLPELFTDENPARPPALAELRQLAVTGPPEVLQRRARELAIRPMPIDDQMRLQLTFLREGLRAVSG